VKRLTLIPLLLLPLVAAAGNVKLDADEWGAPQSGQEVLAREPVRKILEAYAAAPNGTVSIRYPGGDRGTAWAQELRGWLVAFGIGSAHIALEPGSGDGDVVRLELRPAP
jgi:hypothetical protein